MAASRVFGRLWLAVATTAVVLAVTPPAVQAVPFVYVTNRGDRNVSQFEVGAGGLLTSLSPFFVPARALPEGIVVSPDGKSVYVANEGVLVGEPDDEGASVSQYDVGVDGTLSPKSPPWINSCGSLAPNLAISPDGKSVYVPTGGDCSDIRQYDVGANGALSRKTPWEVEPDIDSNPIAVAVSPDSRSVYVTDPSGDSQVLQYDADASGALSPKSPPSVVAAPGFVFLPDIDVSPDGRSVYVVEDESTSQGPDVGRVLQYNVDSRGKLSPKRPFAVPTGDGPAALAVSPDGTSAYVASGGFSSPEGRVSQYDINPTTGALSPKTPATVPTGGVPTAIAVSPDGNSVYVTNAGFFPQRGGVAQYNVGAGGGLSAKSPPMVAAGDSPSGIAVSPLPRVLTTKQQCKHGGWKRFGFKNQGNCIRFVKHRRKTQNRRPAGVDAHP